MSPMLAPSGLPLFGLVLHDVYMVGISEHPGTCGLICLHLITQ